MNGLSFYIDLYRFKELYTNKEVIYSGVVNWLICLHFLLDGIASHGAFDWSVHSCASNHNEKSHQSQIALLFDWLARFRYLTLFTKLMMAIRRWNSHIKTLWTIIKCVVKWLARPSGVVRKRTHCPPLFKMGPGIWSMSFTIRAQKCYYFSKSYT